jgi:hypothetical protein
MKNSQCYGTAALLAILIAFAPWLLGAAVIAIPTGLLIAYLRWFAQRREAYKKNLFWPMDAITAELRAASEACRNGAITLAAAQAVRDRLDDQFEVWKCEAMRSTRTKIPAPVDVISRVLVGFIDRRSRPLVRELESLRKLLQQDDEAANFYLDLILWLLLPTETGETMLGDLKEEFPLKVQELGERGARAWYRSQVFSTVKARLWRLIEIGMTLMGLWNFIGWTRKK